MVQAHIFYTGLVQGVGFRYTIDRFAKEIGLTGWVRNLEDGRVEALVEGEQTQVESLCDKIESYFNDNISDKTIDISNELIGFKNFQVTY